ncbi:MAG: hypothetical protein U5N55_04100 [Cypionkella sp.]|nr:hypothetical protein [Cypionkella sp.]
MAMRALPRGAMAQNPAAAQWLARARALHARMTLDNAHQGAL